LHYVDVLYVYMNDRMYACMYAWISAWSIDDRLNKAGWKETLWNVLPLGEL